MVAARDLPSRNSSRLIGVVRSGSSVPWSRSPITEYAAIVAGNTTGITSRSKRVIATWVFTVEGSSEFEMLKSEITGNAVKIRGNVPIV
jgi:hypothetical protein